MALKKFSHIKRFERLPEDQKQWLINLSRTFPLSFQQLNLLTEYSLDLICWDAGSLAQFYHPDAAGKAKGKQSAAKIFQAIQDGYFVLKNSKRKYPDKQRLAAEERKFPDEQMVEVTLQGNIMGKCPVASEKTRCCNLDTLDAVHQCGFDCSYCSIQSFYHGNQVRFIRDLPSHLEALTLDPDQHYHIGTGQSSDSMMWGNRFGLLDSLYEFTSRHPNVVLEMKSKSSRIDYFLENRAPANMVFTWSLNTPVAIEAEEKGSAPLKKRLESARKLADQRIPVGFHFHPIIWYEGWEGHYGEMVSRLAEMFRPEEIVMVSLGTLTFIKPVLKRIRERVLKSAILQMPMEECAGKLSYPFEIKKELFSTVYNAFPASWHENVFFYMCMENIDLWQPVFGRSYESNEQFQTDMIATYRKKMSMINGFGSAIP